jgi:hypothetical protein
MVVLKLADCVTSAESDAEWVREMLALTVTLKVEDIEAV